MNKKWMLWAGLILILVVFILVWQFAPAIQRWLANVFIDIIVLALTLPPDGCWAATGAGATATAIRRTPATSPRRRNGEAEAAHLAVPERHFMFDALVNGRIDTGSLRFEVEYHDIEALNRGVQAGDADVSKISCAVLPAIAEHYALLDSGAALGRGNGPLLVRRAGDPRPIRRVAVPGVHTTANALMMRLFPGLRSARIAAAVERGDFDADPPFRLPAAAVGAGRRPRGQLGNTGLPLPLGGIAARRSLPDEVRHEAERLSAKASAVRAAI